MNTTKQLFTVRTFSGESADTVSRRVCEALDNNGYLAVANEFAGKITASTENIDSQAVIEAIASEYVTIERLCPIVVNADLSTTMVDDRGVR